LHDLGKIAIPDHVLLKKGALSTEEFALMKRHIELGAGVIDVVESKLGPTGFLRIAKEIILGHHEKWDGTGYPRCLAGDEIPVSARLMAVADVYDALISRRVYKPPLAHEKAVQIIKEGSGTHFDPDVVEAFLRIQWRFKEIALRFLDSEEQRRTLVDVDADSRQEDRVE